MNCNTEMNCPCVKHGLTNPSLVFSSTLSLELYHVTHAQDTEKVLEFQETEL